MNSSGRHLLSYVSALLLNFFLITQIQAQEANASITCPNPDLASWEQLWKDYRVNLSKIQDPEKRAQIALNCIEGLAPHINRDQFLNLNYDLHAVSSQTILKLHIAYFKNKPSLFNEDLFSLDQLLRSFTRVAGDDLTGSDFRYLETVITEGLNQSFDQLNTEFKAGNFGQANAHFKRLKDFQSWRVQHRNSLKVFNDHSYGPDRDLEESLIKTINKRMENAEVQNAAAELAEKERISAESIKVANDIQQKLQQRAQCIEADNAKP